MINGSTAVFGVIGNPVSHSFSPRIHGYFAERHGLDMAYLPFRVADNKVKEAVNGAHALEIKGLNVTIPHKMAVMPYLTKIDDMAEKIGAVNTLVWTEGGYEGYNTDYIGIIRSIEKTGLNAAGADVLIIGAGGSACAAAAAACTMGAGKITIANRNLKNADKVAYIINKHYNTRVEICRLDEISGADIAIQTTTLGFGEKADESPVRDASFFPKLSLAFDIIYTPWETVFLKAAREAGVPCINGFSMLVYQALAAFEIWINCFFGHKLKEYDAEVYINDLQKIYDKSK